MQGSAVAALWMLGLHVLRPSTSHGRLLLALGVLVVLAVLIPAPSVLFGGYADDLVGIYAIAAMLGGAFCAWAVLWRSRGRRQTHPGNGA